MAQQSKWSDGYPTFCSSPGRFFALTMSFGVELSNLRSVQRSLNCKCDDELYECLSQIDNVASNTVGNTFFNIFGRMCYMLDYPRICKKYYTLLGCLEYVIDETAQKVYQWKPAKKYLKMPFTISG
ncbi:hypothetical protein AVEN_267281-1 [Araneus ventricosus]|uniref:Phospholipase A2-like central domain-containing protein n=1 Tax=Araneus ventricosus TaxID=182803 RepID=A0A4Y2S5J2_ARAVE|nr:hypothetical protein AVEN_267281-1 [Araneus ventricosus]